MTARCAKHDLAVAPDGLCVVCRRGARAVSEPAKAIALDGRKLLAGIGAIAMLMLVVGGFVLRREMPPAPALRTTPITTAPLGRTSPMGTAAPLPDDDALSAAPPPRATATAVAAREPSGDREAALRAAEQRVPITVYTTSWCPVCKRAKAWMQANAIPFTERDVEADPSAENARRALTSSNGVPTIDVDGEVIVGFSEGKVRRAIRNAAARRL
jgi:glutaredoxin